MSKRIRSKYTEDWLPIKNIANGMIILENNEKVTGVKIRPRNIFILDADSQINILIGLKNFYNTIDYEFWMICADRPVDIGQYLASLQNQYNNQASPAVKKLIMEDINKANMFMKNNVVDTEYYIIFKAKDDDLIYKRIKLIKQELNACGLTSDMTSNDDMYVIMNNFFNGGMMTTFNSVMPA
ncbi:MAG: hypothetical protein ACK5NF_06950 [Bacilli bacterium]